MHLVQTPITRPRARKNKYGNFAKQLKSLADITRNPSTFKGLLKGIQRSPHIAPSSPLITYRLNKRKAALWVLTITAAFLQLFLA